MIRTNTSASNFHRRKACLASAVVEKGLADIPSPDSEEGTMLHALWADKSLSRDHLTDEQHEALAAVEKMEIAFFGRLIPAPQREVCYRLFEGTEHQMDNHPDAVDVSEEGRGIILLIKIADAKFGRVSVPKAEENWQLAVYACAFLEHLETKFRVVLPLSGQRQILFRMAIFQPWSSRTVEPVEMSLEEVRSVREVIKQTLIDGESPGAPFSPSIHNCRYCKGKLHFVCPAVMETSLAPTKDQSLVHEIKKDAVSFLRSLDPERRAALLDAFDLASDLRERCRDAARVLLTEDTNAIAGYKVGKPGETRKITDVIGFVTHIQARGATPLEVWKAASISIANAESLVKKATGLKGEELKTEAKNTLAPFVDVTPKQGALERV